MEKLTHWKLLMDNKFLGKHHFLPNEKKVLKIKEVKVEIHTVQRGKQEEFVVLYWQSNDCPLILNKTNSEKIQKVLKTPYIEKWSGQSIELFVDKNVSFGGEKVGGVRVSSNKPNSELTLNDYKKQIFELSKTSTVANKDELIEQCKKAKRDKSWTIEFAKDIISQLSPKKSVA